MTTINKMDDSDSNLLLCLAAYHVRNNKPKHSRFLKRYYKQLDYYKQKLRDKRIPRTSLQHPRDSAWRILLRSGNDHALVTLTGLDYDTFKGWYKSNKKRLHAESNARCERIFTIQLFYWN